MPGILLTRCVVLGRPWKNHQLCMTPSHPRISELGSFSVEVICMRSKAAQTTWERTNRHFLTASKVWADSARKFVFFCFFFLRVGTVWVGSCMNRQENGAEDDRRREQNSVRELLSEKLPVRNFFRTEPIVTIARWTIGFFFFFARK
jgi:hypothetical protein